MNNVSKPSMITRSGWGASAAGSMTALGSVTKLVVHHCASNNTTVTNRTPAAHQKYIQDLHKNSNGWSDIGYHFAVGRDGTILEGRNRSYQGAHVSGHNSYTLGIVVHGDYRTRTFTSTQKSKLAHLIAWLMYTYNISSTTSGITYHQALAATACPGTNIINQMSSIRDEVYDLLYGTGISSQTTSESELCEEESNGIEIN